MEQNQESQTSPKADNSALKENHIILFANQKGGAGKTTLCAIFANYLVEKGVPVAVLDADPQQTFYRRRKKDIRHIGESRKVPYNVQAITISGRQSTRGILNYARTLDGTTIIDSPGSLTQEGMLELVPNCDFIICPYHYDLNTVDSTCMFLSLVVRILQATDDGHKPQILFVCNKNDSRVGTAAEAPTWKATDAFFAKYGKIIPRIGIYRDMEKYSTFDNSNIDEMHYKASFDTIFKEIYGIEDE